jgi:hypothetical protein
VQAVEKAQSSSMQLISMQLIKFAEIRVGVTNRVNLRQDSMRGEEWL